MDPGRRRLTVPIPEQANRAGRLPATARQLGTRMNRHFLRWISRQFNANKDKAESFRCRKVASPPGMLEERTLYVVGDDECDWAVLMHCPCGCRSTIHLSLARDSRPSWRVRRCRDGTVSLLPSVWRTVGCRSHFILHRGKILWCRGMPHFNDTSE